MLSWACMGVGRPEKIEKGFPVHLKNAKLQTRLVFGNNIHVFNVVMTVHVHVYTYRGEFLSVQSDNVSTCAWMDR